jgi:hypothetical protein
MVMPTPRYAPSGGLFVATARTSYAYAGVRYGPGRIVAVPMGSSEAVSG